MASKRRRARARKGHSGPCQGGQEGLVRGMPWPGMASQGQGRASQGIPGPVRGMPGPGRAQAAPVRGMTGQSGA